MAALTGALIAGTALSAGSSLMGASANASALEAQGDHAKMVGDFNAKLSEMQAQDALERGGKDAEQLQKQASRMIGSQKAALAAQGIEVDSGSAAEIQNDTKEMAARDAVTIRNNAAREAFGFKVQAMNSTMEGNFAQMGARNQASNTLLVGGMSAASTVMQGGAKVYETSNAYKTKG